MKADAYYISRVRYTFTPPAGAPLVLMEEGDWCDSPLTLEATLAEQVEQPILAEWVSHHSRGNAQTQLEFTQYAPAATREAAELAGFARWQQLIAAPEGELLLETAFAGSTTQVSQRLHATLTRCRFTPMEEADFFATGAGLAMSYTFTITPIAEDNQNG